MQYIDTNLPNIIEARDTHYAVMRYILKKKLNGIAFSDPSPIPNMKINKISGIRDEIAKYLNDEKNLKIVLIGTPEQLNRIKNKFTEKDELKESVEKLLNYETWSKKNDKKYDAYDLAEKLDIPTCVYCNRIYTKTVISHSGKKITRPTFDHWFPQKDYPLLALSFYNLIPSCSICNSELKGSTVLALSTHFHPYYKKTSSIFNYTFSYNHKDYNKFSFKIKTNNRFSKNSIDAFELEEIYKAHEDEIEDLRRIKDAYSEKYIEMLQNNILGTEISLDRNEVYRLAFGVHFQEEHFYRRPLSKMKKDILTELGII